MKTIGARLEMLEERLRYFYKVKNGPPHFREGPATVSLSMGI